MQVSRQLVFEKLYNTRDLGGMIGAGGRKVRSGKLIRSGQLCKASAADRDALSSLTELIIDFRTDGERSEKPDPQVDGAENLHMPILESLKAGITREHESDEKAIRILLKDQDRCLEYMCNNYVQFIETPAARQHYADFVRLLLKERDKAVLWHCTAGKDRAGFGAVIVEELLGVSREAILNDYLKTNECLKPEVEKMHAMIRLMMIFSRWGDQMEKAFGYLFGAHKEFLDAAYTRAGELYGSFEGFLADGLGITQEEKVRLQELYLE